MISIFLPSHEFVDRATDIVKDIDKEIRNKFKWGWLEEKDCNGDFLSSYV